MTSKHNLRTFYTIILTQVFSIIGSRMSGLAIGIKVFDDTGKATPLALVALFSLLPNLIFVNIAGVIADRWDRRRVMMFSDFGQALGTLLLLISFASNSFELWHLYAVAVLQSIFGVFQGPAVMASVTTLVEDKHRDRANAILQMMGPAAGLIAPILTGALFVLLDVTGIIAIDLITFLVAVAVISTVHIPTPPKSAEGEAAKGSMLQEVQVGFKFLWSRRMLFYLLLHAMLLNFLFNMAGIYGTPYILSLTGSKAVLGVLLAIEGAAMIGGGLFFTAWGGTKVRMHTMMPGVFVMGIAFMLYGIARSPVFLAASIFFGLFVNPMVNACFMSLLQIKTPPDIQGRVFAALQMMAMGMTPLAYIIAGPLADNVMEPAVGGSAWKIVEPIMGTHEGAGMGLIFSLNGLICALVTLGLYAYRPYRQLEADLPDYVATPAAEAVTETVVESMPATNPIESTFDTLPPIEPKATGPIPAI